MIDVDLRVYVNALFVLMFASIIAFIYITHSFRNSEYSNSSLSCFKAYFIAGLIGWVGLWVKDAANLDITLAISLIAYILVSGLLLAAIIDCIKNKRQLTLLVIIHLIFTLGSLLLKNDSNRILYLAIYTACFYPVMAWLVFQRARNKKNIGYGIIGIACSLVVIIIPIQIYGLYAYEDPNLAYGISLIGSSTGFVLVGIGFLTSILVEEHKKLQQLALIDPLTSLYNRRGMGVAIDLPVASEQRETRCISAIAVDIDNFKKINDRYGHDTGDEVLIELAKILKQHARASDAVCRMGGEEFVIVSPETVNENAVIIADRIRRQVEGLELKYGENTITLTSSFGVATHCGTIDIDYLLKDADKALYQAKNDGRNRVATLAVKK